MVSCPLVSVIIPCRNEELFIKNCLESIINNDYPKDKLEVLIVDGMSDDGTRKIVNQHSIKNVFIRLLDNPKKIIKEAIRIVKKGGKIIITVPSYLSEFPLKILAKINLISKKEVKEHKNYFNKENLFKLLPNKKLNIYHCYFESGLNNLLVIEKAEG